MVFRPVQDLFLAVVCGLFNGRGKCYSLGLTVRQAVWWTRTFPQ